MTIATQINPPWISGAAYVDFLNRGFPGQWDRVSYEWYLRRSFNGRPTDIAVRTRDGQILAGAAYCYRHVDDGSAPPVPVCVMSAGATLPAERGRGHYAELLQTGIELCKRHGCAALLGFTTRENASARGMLRMGAYRIPSFYIVSTARRRPPRSESSARRIAAAPPLRASRALQWRPRHERDGALRFLYERREDWEAQFIARPNPVRAIRMAHDAVALVETVGSTDRLQWLDCPERKAVAHIAALAGASASAGRSFFMYTLNPAEAAAADRIGLDVRDGLLHVLPTNAAAVERLCAGRWRLQSGDRM